MHPPTISHREIIVGGEHTFAAYSLGDPPNRKRGSCALFACCGKVEMAALA
jgi:hypothetical protein